MDVVDGRPGAALHLAGPAVEGCDAVTPQPVEQVGVVAVAEERLRIGPHQLRIEMTYSRDLVVPPDSGQDVPDLWITESGVEVGGAVVRDRVEPSRRRV